jgi:hypothetical protein
MLELQEQPAVEPDAETLFKEARRRERQRRAVIAVVGLVVVGAVVACVLLLDGGGSGKASPEPRRSAGPAAIVATAALKQPMSLAVSRAGVLYIVDPARDQILRRLRDGRFAVVAGNGHVGFSGDGGPATKAALRLSDNSDVAVGASGTIYFADTGNDRVRAVLPDGRIETVAGDGHRVARDVGPPYLTGSRRAVRTELDDPTSLAFGPGGKLYISAQDIVALSNGGTLSYFAGPTSPRFGAEDHLSQGPGAAIAFDRAGDMFVSSFPWLTERTAAGQILFLGDGFRSDGAQGILASSPNGTVYEGYGDFGGIVNRLVNPRPVANGQIMSVRGLQSVVSPDLLRRLLKTRGKGKFRNGFGPKGLAIAGSGAIYTDTDSGYWSSVGALVEITSSGHVRRLWISH